MAAEVFLDSVLGLLHWERFGGAPLADGAIDRAVISLSKDLRPRLRSEYHPLIGGRWDVNAGVLCSNGMHRWRARGTGLFIVAIGLDLVRRPMRLTPSMSWSTGLLAYCLLRLRNFRGRPP
jgi:hypothetical protein